MHVTPSEVIASTHAWPDSDGGSVAPAAARLALLPGIPYIFDGRTVDEGGDSMAVKSTIDPNSGVIVHSVAGDTSLDELVRALERIVDHPLYQPGADALWDFSGAEVRNVDGKELRNLVRQVRQRLAGRDTGYKVALVAPRDVDYGLARMYEAYASELPIELSVFRSSGDAWDWLWGGAKPPAVKQND
ncbi:MAG: hypothetical protein JSW71_15210 [Gemmatimonadota bacterium]|nr:MAG: hypothetical protein JSW71_15210 [Gemmatimonadota bacterium]